MLVGMLALSMAAAAADDSWRVPLSQKADIFERNVLERHWIDGLYPSSVEVPLDGGPVDQTTQGSSNIAHSINWTSYYLGGQCFRYLFTQDPAVREHCNRVFEAIYRCQLVTGVRGLQARGYARGHGDSYEEREDSGHANDWHQGAGEYRDYRWRGSPSHHNYSGAIYALGMYYDLVAEGAWKDRCREAIDALVSYWSDEPDFIIKKYDGSISTPILGFTDGRTPNTRIIMAAAGLRVAYHATGSSKYLDRYRALTDQYQFRTWRQPIQGRDSFDDTDHVLQHMENMLRIEDDAELRAFYEHVAADLWAAHQRDRQALFNYIYFGLFPDAAGKEEALADALWTLQSYPTVKVFRPRMNSIRDDIETADGRAKAPLPLYESPWDNEYQWKGHLYALDGWLSRVVVSLASPSEDGAVLYAADTRGDLYKSVDGAKTWRQIGENLVRPVRRVAAGPRVRMAYVVADDGVYRTSTAGERWHRLPLPAGAGAPREVSVDPRNGNVLYVATDAGLYRSRDYGEAWIGERWECLTTDLPPSLTARFALAFGSPNVWYAVLDDVVFRRADGAERWTRGAELGSGGYTSVYPWIVPDPHDTERIVTGFRAGAGRLTGNWLSTSEDGGNTFDLGLRQVYERFRQGGLTALLGGRIEADINTLLFDPRAEGILYIGTRGGVLVSEDGGRRWERRREGLPIPVVETLFAPAATAAVFAGTPGGLYVSYDRGNHWQDANLRLIFEGNSQREVGSADYLDAYWRGRYYGFITDAAAEADPTTWEGHPRR
jgi:hypothetical protein